MSRDLFGASTWGSVLRPYADLGQEVWRYGCDIAIESEEIDGPHFIADQTEYLDPSDFKRRVDWFAGASPNKASFVWRGMEFYVKLLSIYQLQRRVTGSFDSQSWPSIVVFKSTEKDSPDWEDAVDYEAPRPEEILSGLKTESDPDRRRLLIFHTEDVHFSEPQREDLAPLLLDFIERNRDSNNRLDVVATASAIRRYVSVLRVEDLGKVIPLLRPRDGVTASPENQLEILKMLARTYEVLPPSHENPEPDLAKEVFRVAEAHLNPYVFEGDMHAAIALHACLALAGMASPEALEAYSQTRDLPFVWFRNLVRRETQKMENLWETKADSTILQRLRKLIEVLDAAQPAEAEVARPSA